MEGFTKANYNVSLGLVEAIVGVTNLEKQEVWTSLAEAAEVCFERMRKKGIRESWRWLNFPGTELRIKIKTTALPGVVGKGFYNAGQHFSGHCYIKFDGNQTESFTSTQVEEFIVEKVLLGIDE